MTLAEPVTADFVNTEEKKLLRTIRRLVLLFIVLLILSGLTAFPGILPLLAVPRECRRRRDGCGLPVPAVRL